jgi:6-phosphogluconolactonase
MSVPPASDLDGDAAVARCAADVADLLADAADLTGRAVLAVCGGATAERVLQRLARDARGLARVTVLLADERCAPEGGDGRNETMVRAVLDGSGATVMGVGPADDPVAAAASYDSRTAHLRIDVALVSLADDGHVASLFPGHPALADPRGIVPVTDSPKPPSDRISMSVVRLRGAHHRLVAAIGGTKHGAVERLRAGDRGPSALIEPTRWYLDRAASHDGAAR